MNCTHISDNRSKINLLILFQSQISCLSWLKTPAMDNPQVNFNVEVRWNAYFEFCCTYLFHVAHAYYAFGLYETKLLGIS